jgi:hypothetical protein
MDEWRIYVNQVDQISGDSGLLICYRMATTFSLFGCYDFVMVSITTYFLQIGHIFCLTSQSFIQSQWWVWLHLRTVTHYSTCI